MLLYILEIIEIVSEKAGCGGLQISWEITGPEVVNLPYISDIDFVCLFLLFRMIYSIC